MNGGAILPALPRSWRASEGNPLPASVLAPVCLEMKARETSKGGFQVGFSIAWNIINS